MFDIYEIVTLKLFAVKSDCGEGSSTETVRAAKRFRPEGGVADGPSRSVPPSEVDEDSHIKHINQSIRMEVFIDPETENKKLIVIVVLPSGSMCAEFNLVGAGPGTNLARVTYTWPEVLYNIEKLYAKSIEEGALTNYHPRLVALKNGLTNHRETKNDVPVGEIHLQLPISVLTAENTISRQGVRVKETGAFLLITELTAYETLYNQEKKPIVFVEKL